MIKSLLPFTFSRDKKTIVPNKFIFGCDSNPIDFSKYSTKNISSLQNQQENLNLYFDQLQYIKLENNYETTFWRYQNNSDACLSTIEAAYYCIKEISTKIPGKCIFIY